MLNCIKNEEKNNEPIECVNNPNLVGFKKTDSVKLICYQFYGEANGPKCSEKKHFCHMCCNHYIGIKHVKEQKECFDKCEAGIGSR